MNLNIEMRLPEGSFYFKKGSQKTETVKNTITYSGVEVFSTSSYPNPIVDSTGGKLKYVRLGESRDVIQIDSSKIGGDIPQYNVQATNARINYITADGRRYADIHILYEFPAATRKYYIHQVGLFSNNVNANMLFGQTLDEPLVIEENEVFSLYYSIRVEVISNWLKVGESDFGSTDYVAYARFHYEEQDMLTTRWPYDTGGQTITSGWAARPILDNQVIGNGTTRYTSSTEFDGTKITRDLRYLILAQDGGERTFFNLEIGNYSNSSQGYSIRIVFGNSIYKSVENVLRMHFKIILNWVSV